MAYLLKNINETPCKIVLNCYISFFQLDTFRFVGFTSPNITLNTIKKTFRVIILFIRILFQYSFHRYPYETRLI